MKISEFGPKRKIKLQLKEMENNIFIHSDEFEEKIKEKVISGNKLLEELYEGIISVYKNGSNYEYVVNCGRMGLVFDFKENLITTHT